MDPTAVKILEEKQTKYQTEIENFNKAQKKYDKLVRLNGQLDTQLNENMMVKEELELCKEDSKVYKLLGDVLVPQGLDEARTNVQRRMDYIKSELKRNSEVINDQKKEMGTFRENIAKMEKDVQQLAQSIGVKPVA